MLFPAAFFVRKNYALFSSAAPSSAIVPNPANTAIELSFFLTVRLRLRLGFGGSVVGSVKVTRLPTVDVPQVHPTVAGEPVLAIGASTFVCSTEHATTGTPGANARISPTFDFFDRFTLELICDRKVPIIFIKKI
ncbi:hypothetical protein [Haliscomenobacter hydrossis]|uniref:Uncharacterized protein n=1 Tax=Haliscomenobacter hydrossis (strain ATCC 27775 / DSM 1100 / LMG 10767 / O) TaxID=760192 RepID=F4L5R2_HALH1|nr:hypothetical protein [Haliscomenobacter hydrossis]AEE51897.1 hypothetical protein Halhy_4049 [Haliscomenobacter hydrossis DSM 1100]